MRTYNHTLRKNKRCGFTLIEVMIVIVIISIIAAVVIPRLLHYRKTISDITAPSNQLINIAQTSLKVSSLNDIDTAGAPIPLGIEEANILLDLEVDYVFEGRKTTTLYNADFNAEYVIKNPLSEPNQLIILFPFPENAGTFSNVQFLIKENDNYISPEKNIRYTEKGIEWQKEFASEEEIRVKVQYNAKGKQDYTYQTVSKHKMRKFDFTMNVKGIISPNFSSNSLYPENKDVIKVDSNHWKVAWHYEDFITSSNIRIEFPSKESLLNRFILLTQLAGFSLFFFGLFFWYFGEDYKPEAINRPNFAILILLYTLFFPAFIFLQGYLDLFVPEYSLLLSFFISLIFTSALIVFHTTTFMGLRYALTRALPMILTFISGLVWAIMIKEIRGVIFSIATIGLMGFVIYTNANLQRKKREKEAKEKAEKEKIKKAKEEKHKKALEEYQEQHKMKPQEEIETITDTEQSQIDTEKQEVKEGGFCIFCGTTISGYFDYCPKCGSKRHLFYNCNECDTEYPLEYFRGTYYCKECGAILKKKE